MRLRVKDVAVAIEISSVLLQVLIIDAMTSEPVQSGCLEIGINGSTQLVIPAMLLHQMGSQQGTQQEAGIVVAVIDTSLVVGRKAPGD